MLQFDDDAMHRRLGAVIAGILRTAPGTEVIVSVQPDGYGIHVPEYGQFHIVKKSLEERLTA